MKYKYLLMAILSVVSILSISLVANALLAPIPRCDGNICSDTLTVGQNINIKYTQHVHPNGTLKVRWYESISTGNQIQFAINYLPSIDEYAKYASPSGFALSQHNTTATAYTAWEPNGYNGYIDMVMAINFSNVAEGEYNITLAAVQLGEPGQKIIQIYVDNNAPKNNNESFVYVPVTGSAICADDIDNDLDYDEDCADVQCDGISGGAADCEANETTCDDGFDNDGDTLTDCLDPHCDGLDGGAGDCEYGNETGATNCQDSFDNDAQGGTDCLDQTTCWHVDSWGCDSDETGIIECNNGKDDDDDSDYSNSYDSNPNTGADCTDYGCSGVTGCPTNEDEQAAWCFDGVDNDLDDPAHANSEAYRDCADPDCQGVVNPADPTEVCYDSEFNVTAGVQVCNNGLDDDGDGDIDCADSDCNKQFGVCGPCPAIENITHNSCADTSDNDYDGLSNCADDDCDGEIGRVNNAARCEVETGANCNDGFDNDNDGNADCKDSGCATATGPDGQICGVENTAGLCSDGDDNDQNLDVDCMDSKCWPTASCANKTWSSGSCITVPAEDSYQTFGTPGNFKAKQLNRLLYVNQQHQIKLESTGTYSSATITIGNGNIEADNYPYDGTTCVLTGTNSNKFALSLGENVIQVQGIGINTTNPVAGFDLTLTCNTSGTPQALKSYPIVSSFLDTSSAEVDKGTNTYSTQLFENTAPDVTTIEIGGEVGGTVEVKVGGTVEFRAIPTNDASGICGCTLNAGGSLGLSDSNCIKGKIFNADTSVTPSATAEDSADNTGSSYTHPSSVTIEVIPKQTSAPEVDKTYPFYLQAESVTVNASFQTGTGDTFSSCTIVVEDSAGNVESTDVAAISGTNSVTCSGTVAVPNQDDMYLIYINATDSDGDKVTSDKMPFYACDSLNSSGTGWTCAKADFDQDGAAEGLFTSLYNGPLTCDNCLGKSNPAQADVNANGIGDVCDGALYCGDGICSAGENETNCPEDCETQQQEGAIPEFGIIELSIFAMLVMASFFYAKENKKKTFIKK